MKLTVFNGSPKPGADNTGILAAHFADGFSRVGGNTCETYKLNRFGDLDEAVRIFRNAECVIIAFPLYNYAMPAIVKEFIERIGSSDNETAGGKIGFIVQFGFPEAIHARPLERYLEKLAGLLRREYLGTVLKGGCSRLSAEPGRYRRTLEDFETIGAHSASNGRFDEKLLARLSGPDRLFAPKIILKGIAHIMNTYWNPQLKKNGTYRNRSARPYQ